MSWSEFIDRPVSSSLKCYIRIRKMKAVFLIVLIALCAAQRMEASPVSVDTRGLSDIAAHIKDAIERAIQKLMEIDMESILAELIEVLDNAAQLAQDAVDAAVERVRQTVEDLVNKAAEAGKNVGPCVEGKEAELEEIKNDAKVAINACSQEAVASMQPTLTEIAKVFSEALQLREEVEDAVASCNGTVSEYAIDKEHAKCLVPKLVSLTPRAVALALKVPGVVREAKAAYEAAAESANVCRRAVLVDASIKTARVAAEVGMCIAKA